MFVSSYESAIDAKGRVSVPAAFRAALGGGTRVYVWPALGGKTCLEGGGEQLMAMYQQTIMRLPPLSPEREALTTAIMSSLADLKMDDPGRIKIPEDMLASVGITDRILFVGALESFQIWEPDTYAAYRADMAARATEPGVIGALAQPYGETVAAGGVAGIAPSGKGED